MDKINMYDAMVRIRSHDIFCNYNTLFNEILNNALGLCINV